MMYWLGQTAKELRLGQEQLTADIAVIRRCDTSTVTRFEAGKMREIDVDLMIEAYSRALDVPEIEIWQRALDAWREHPDAS